MNKTYLALGFVYLIILVAAVYVVYNTGTSCISEPQKFFFEQIEKTNDAKLTCFCSLDKPNMPTLLLTKDGIQPLKEQKSVAVMPVINFTDSIKWMEEHAK